MNTTNTKDHPLLTACVRHLEQEGWREYPPSSLDSFNRAWFKRFPDASQDWCNSEKPGVQIGLEMWDHRPQHHHIGFELRLYGECEDGYPVRLRAYCIGPESLSAVLDSQVDKLLRAWEACQ